MCQAEKLYVKCHNICQRKLLHINFVRCRKGLSKAVQKSKRLYWLRMQNDLLLDLDKNSRIFWKSIGKIGVAFQKKNKIPMAVVDDSGKINNDNDFVLNKWKSFSNLYNASDQNNVVHDNNVVNNDFIPEFEDEISIFEIHKAVFN